jgi:monoterpene epsilon-lactone hydrolase
MHDTIAEWQLPPERAGRGADSDLAARRQMFARPRRPIRFSSRSDRDRMFPIESARVATETYLQGHDPRDPLASPLLADLAGFPPTLMLVGGAETLLSDATRLAGRLADAGTTVSAHAFAELQHVWPVTSPQLAETKQAMQLIAQFVEHRS